MSKRFTHTATLTVAVEIGPWQLPETVRPGTTVEVYQDPAQQDGDVITIRRGNRTGVARIADLSNVQVKA